MPTNVLALGLYSTAAASLVTGTYFLKLKMFTAEDVKAKANAGFGTAITFMGLYTFIAGLYLLAGTPLNAPYNEYFGAITTMFGMLLLMGGLSIKNDWDLRPVSYFAAIGGIIAANHTYINELIIHNANYPYVFVSAAIAGFSLLPATHIRNIWVSRIAGILIIVLGLVTLYIGVTAFQGHIVRGLTPAPAPAPAPAR